MNQMRRVIMSKFTAAQKSAIHACDNNFVVSAGAGSGKTTVLSERVLELLKKGKQINKMLILTFTVNAAVNMRDKIREKIKENLTSNPSLAEQMKYLESADICTFDSFNQKIVRKYRTYLGIGDDFTIADDSYMVTKKNEIIDRIFQKYYENSDIDFLNLLATYTIRNDDNIRKYIMDIDKYAETTSSYSVTITNARNLLLTDDLVDQVYADMTNTINSFIDQTAIRIDNHPRNGVNEDFFEDYKNSILNLKSVSVDEYKTKHVTFKAPRIPGRLPEEISKPLQNLKKAIKEKLDKFANCPTMEEYKNDWANSRKYKEVILNLVEEYHAMVEEFKKKNAAYEFSDIAIMALRLLSEFPSVRKEVKESYDEIMVDEYQDNSDLQEDMINLLESKNLFMVGDVKQSIYRFRNANPSLFMNRYEKYKNQDNGEKIDMNENFRSSPAVIDDVNYIFSRIMSLDFGGADYEKEHIIISSNDIYKSLTNLRNRKLCYEHDTKNEKSEEEAIIIAEDILSRMESGEKIEGRDLKFSDFAIILDRGTKFSTYVEVFTKYGIPLFVDKDQDVRDLTVRDVIKNLFLFVDMYNKSVNSPDEFTLDDKARLKRATISLSRSFLICEKDTIIEEAVFSNNIESLNAYQIAKEVAVANSKKTVFENYVALIHAFDVINKLQTLTEAKENIMGLEVYSKTIQALSDYGLSLSEITKYFDSIQSNDIKISLKVNVNVDNAVTLTNIHKSKGLEYNFCYFAGLSSKYNEEFSKTQFIFNSKFGVTLPYITDNEKCVNPVKFFYDEEEKDDDRAEKIRQLYVALTRAKYCYVMVYPKKEPFVGQINNAKSFGDLLDMATYLIKPTEVKVPDTPRKLSLLNNEETKDYQFTYSSIDDSVYDSVKPQRASKVLTHANKETLEFGTKLHKIVESVDLKNPVFDFKDELLNRAVRNLYDVLKTLSINDAEIYHEYEYYDEERQSFGSIDLLLVYNNHIIIIDFKTKNIDDKDYVKQLAIYKDNIVKIFTLPVETYLYSLLDGKLEKSE